MVNCVTFRVSRDEFVPFDSELDCLRWILQNRAHLNRTLPGAKICAVRALASCGVQGIYSVLRTLI